MSSCNTFDALENIVKFTETFLDDSNKECLDKIKEISSEQKEMFLTEMSLRTYLVFVIGLHKYLDNLSQEALDILNKLVKNFTPLSVDELKKRLTDENITDTENRLLDIPPLFFVAMLLNKSFKLDLYMNTIVSFLPYIIKDNFKAHVKFKNIFYELFVKKNKVEEHLEDIFSLIIRTTDSEDPSFNNARIRKEFFIMLNEKFINIGKLFFESYNKEMIFTINSNTCFDTAVQKDTTVDSEVNTDIAAQTAAAVNSDTDINDALQELNDLIGLGAVKKDVNELINLIKVTNLRKSQGMKTPPVSLHLVFTGNPGTGKTTVARLIAKIYKALGVIKRDEILEVDRADLVAGYLGQTAIKTQEVIHKALGGILFIDEAYSLSSANDDYGQEAINTLLKGMEDNRDKLILIVAGYTEEMKAFLNSNPGLRSRFNKYIDFPDYSPGELTSIFIKMFEKNEFIFSNDVKIKIKNICYDIYNNKDENFANARSIRNIFEKVLRNNANRIANIQSPTLEELQTIVSEDFDDTY